VFARGIEQSCLAAVLRYAKRRGASEVTGQYLRTAKNGKVADFYQRAGFAADPAEGPDDGPRIFRHRLHEIAEAPGHVRLIEEFGGPDLAEPAPGTATERAH
jgi:hypothetical protein